MIGDQEEIAYRLRSVIPARWFGGSTPVLDTVLGALGAGWASLFNLLRYSGQQTRIATASDIWLDLVGLDYFGSRLPRALGQSDQSYRWVLLKNILRPLGTRSALIAALADLTGRVPTIFEPANPSDTGGYAGILAGRVVSGGGLGYGTAGGWGNLSLPFQCFVTAYRPYINGAANLSGWTMAAAGYGVGALEYVGADTAQGQITDSAISLEISKVCPVGLVVWVRIAS
jgi:hypothetical protein